MPSRTLWIGTEPEPDDRAKIEVSQEDYNFLDDLDRDDDKGLEVFDYRTSGYVRIRWASCGASCRCAMEFVNPQQGAN
jgi:hypothetical protein